MSATWSVRFVVPSGDRVERTHSAIPRRNEEKWP